MRTFILATIILIGLSNLARAQPGSIEVSDAWARATAGSSPGGAFMTIVNAGTSDDRLVAASTTVARTAELHETKDENGVMKMTPVPALEIKAGTRVTLAPGGLHIMLTGLKAPLKQGESFPLVLRFDKAGAVNVMVKVEKPGAMTSGMNMN
jgi:copper(I)-binding protein